MHFLVAHGYETPACFVSWIMQEPFFNVTQTEGFDQAYISPSKTVPQH